MILFLSLFLTLIAGGFTDQYEENLNDFILKHGFGQLFGDETGEYEIITPIHHNRYQRSTEGHPDEQFYTLEAFGQRFQLDLQKTKTSYLPSVKVVYRNEDGSVTEENKLIEDCLYHGELSTHDDGSVAVSTCNGLTGLIRTSDGDYIIQPVPEAIRQRRDVHDEAHIIFKKKHSGEKVCAVKKDPISLFTGSRTKRYQPNNAAQANQLTVETAIFADNDLYQYFQKTYPRNTDDQLLQYVLATMNAIQLLYNDPSLLGIPINFILIRLDIFKTNRVSFQITDDAERYLDSFCQWQQRINTGTDNDPDHWDHAFMLTGLDIQAGGSRGVIGIAPLRGMCKPQISCTLTEARFFQGVFTGGHEAGHNFGMEHDGDGNGCDSHKFLMAPMDEAGQVTWSTCSRSQMMQYLQNPVTVCLLDHRRPTNLDHTADRRPPGQRFDANLQCSLGFGSSYRPDNLQPLSEICFILKCTDGRYIQKAHPALEGTYCGPGAWCRGGRCVNAGGMGPQPVNGGWGQWSQWTECKSSCLVGGTGITSSSRQCNNPSPSNGGQDCQGERLQSNICNDNFCRNRMTNLDYATTVCRNAPNNHQVPLSGAGGQLFHDETGGCLVWCEKRGQRGQYSGWGATFPDGTDCSQGRGNSFCVSGKCQPVKGGSRGYREVAEREIKTPRWEVYEWGSCSKECDGGVQIREVQCVIDWKPDVKKIIPYIECSRLDEPQPEKERACNEQLCVVGIPREARGVIIPRWEISEWGDCDKKCDGGVQTRVVQCVIDWKPNVQKVIPSIECQRLDGSVPDTERPCNEQLCIVGMVRQERAALIHPGWEISEWSKCSKDCGGGSQTRTLKCVISWQGRKMETLFSECDKAFGRPERSQKCNVQKCEGARLERAALIHPEWEMSEWSKCSRDCGGGSQTRTLKCVISWQGRKMETLFSECDKAFGRPERSQQCNVHKCEDAVRQERALLIKPEWEISEWSKCSKDCGEGSQTRSLKCVISWQGRKMETLFSECDKAFGRPERSQQCNVQKCEDAVRQERAPIIEPEWEISEWSKCSKDCGGGSQTRTLKCIISWQGRKMETLFSECDKAFGRPERSQRCNLQKCEA